MVKRTQFTLRSMMWVVAASAAGCWAILHHGPISAGLMLLPVVLLLGTTVAIFVGLSAVFHRWAVPILALLGMVALFAVLLMPNVQQAREIARRTPCRNGDGVSTQPI